MVIFLTSIFISNVQEESEYNESIKNEKICVFCIHNAAYKHNVIEHTCICG